MIYYAPLIRATDVQMVRTNKQIRVELVEDSGIFRPALQALLARMGFLCASNGHANGHSHVIVINLVTYAGTLAELEAQVQEASRRAPVLVLAGGHTPKLVSALRAGAIGCVRSDAGPEQLREAICAVADGRASCERELFSSVMRSLVAMPQGQEQPSITPREQQVLAFVSGGRTNKEIAQQLGLSEQSVKVYISNLLRKTGALNRSGLASYALGQRMVRILTVASCFLHSLWL